MKKVIALPQRVDKQTQINQIQNDLEGALISMLPFEILCKVATNLGISGLKQLSLTSRTFHFVAQPEINLLRDLNSKLSIPSMVRPDLKLSGFIGESNKVEMHNSGLRHFCEIKKLSPTQIKRTQLICVLTPSKRTKLIEPNELSQQSKRRKLIEPNELSKRSKRRKLSQLSKTKDIGTMTDHQIPTNSTYALPVQSKNIEKSLPTNSKFFSSTDTLSHPHMLQLLKKLAD